MEVLYRCCCGLDVHKKSITACVLWAEGKGRRKEKRTLGTFTRDLLSLLDWLKQCGSLTLRWNQPGCTGNQCGTSWKDN